MRLLLRLIIIVKVIRVIMNTSLSCASMNMRSLIMNDEAGDAHWPGCEVVPAVLSEYDRRARSIA